MGFEFRKRLLKPSTILWMLALPLLSTANEDKNSDAKVSEVTSTTQVVSESANASELVCDRVLEDFSKPDEFQLPSGWISHSKSDLKRARKNKIYQLSQDESGNFLKANAVGDGVILHKDISEWNLKKYPVLRWKWRVHQLPLGAHEGQSSINDAGAAVYVIWKSSFVMRVKSIKMTWSSTLKPGTHIVKRLGYDHVHVLQSGPELKDQWVTEVVNLQELAKRYYPDEKDPPIALALMSDGDNTKSPSSADYAGFEMCRSVDLANADSKGRDPARK